MFRSEPHARMLTKSVAFILIVHGLLPRVIADPTSSVSATTVSTAVPSVSASLNAPLPSQASLPPKQAWCPSEIFCAGAVSHDFTL